MIDSCFEQVLDQLRFEFKRACVFSYDSSDPKSHGRRRAVASEEEFDEFCSHAERFDNKCDVYIVNASFKPSAFIKAEPNPLLVQNGEAELALLREQQRTGGQSMQEEAGLLQLGGEGDAKIRKKKRSRIKQIVEDAPYPLENTLAFGLSGLLVSCGIVIYGYLQNLNTLAAVTLALPVNIFVLCFYVSAVFPTCGFSHC